MSGKQTLAHTCPRRNWVASSWEPRTPCPTCNALEAAHESGWDAGLSCGKSIGRYEAQQERTERLTAAARAVLLLVIMGFLIDILSHRPTAEGVTE